MFKVPHRVQLDSIKPYIPGKSIEEVQQTHGLSHIIKLASNENSLGSAVDIDNIIQKERASIFRYPDSAHVKLRSNIARFYGLEPSQVILGNGSDEIIQMVALAFLAPETKVLVSQYSFSEYQFAANIAGSRYIEVPTHEFKLDVTQLLNQVSADTRVVFIANPNNPTGLAISSDELMHLMRHLPEDCLLVLDEAYAEYADDIHFPQFQSFLSQFPNLLVLRTFSKIYGLAGLRIGYGMGHPQLVSLLQKVRQPFNINRISLSAGIEALNNQIFVKQSQTIVWDEKKRLYQILADAGIKFLLTQANFICIKVNTNATHIADQLLEKGVIVRPLNSFGMSEYIRVSIGTHEENNMFLNVFLNNVFLNKERS